MTFVPSQLPGIIGHWAADEIAGLSHGDPVDSLPSVIDTWHMTASGTERPTYVASGMNALPAVQFDGTDDFIQTATTKAVTGPVVGFAMVISVPSLKNFQGLFALDSSAGKPDYRRYLACYGTSTGAIITYSGLGYRQSDSSGGHAYTVGDQIIASVPSASRTRMFRNGRPLENTSVNQGADVPQGSYYASFGALDAGGSTFNGELSELVFYDKQGLLDDEYVDGYLAHKYGLTLPTSHRFYAATPGDYPSSGGGTAAFTGIGRTRRLGT